LALVLASGLPAAAELVRPAEQPPPDFAGQQYVDSKGCLFMRAGQAGRESWIPRVTRDGVPLCGNPPSGNRVPVVEEGAPASLAAQGETNVTEGTADPGPLVRLEGFAVAVGSFAEAQNRDAALARLAALNYPAFSGLMSESATLTTVFAGPFAQVEEALVAREALIGSGFPGAMLITP
jgi:cell division septation protein DedD